MREPRLADSRRAENREQVGRPVIHRSFERLSKLYELTLASDHCRLEVARDRRRTADEVEYAPGAPFPCARLGRLEVCRVSDEPLGFLSDQDLSRLSCLRESGRGVHDLSGDGPSAPSQDLAGG